MPRQRSQSVLERRCHRADVIEHALLRDDRERGERNRRTDRMATGGEAVRELLVGLASDGQAAIDLRRQDDRTHREVAGGQHLGSNDNIRLDIIGLAAPEIAGAAEATDYLVGHEGNLVLAEYRLDGREVARRWRNDAARTHHRLGEEASDGIRVLLLDERLKAGCESEDEIRLAFIRKSIAPEMWAVREQHFRQRQTEGFNIVFAC